MLFILSVYYVIYDDWELIEILVSSISPAATASIVFFIDSRLYLDGSELAVMSIAIFSRYIRTATVNACSQSGDSGTKRIGFTAYGLPSPVIQQKPREVIL